MGLRIDRDRFEAAEYARFSERLERSLQALGELLSRPGFGAGEPSLGAELELFLIDSDGRPLPLNRAVLRETVDPRLTVELARFNVECNLRPTPLAGRSFSALAQELGGAVAEVRRAARAHQGRAAMIGILPTLRTEDLQRGAMTDVPRYRALSSALRQLRRGPFQMEISGAEPLEITCDDVTFEGANTSLQLHLRIAPGAFARVFNAAQLASAPALAVAANSPTFLGHRLWEETRVALFKQAVDDRGPGKMGESRVAFGSGWVTEGALELFVRNVARHEPLLPILGDEDPLERVREGAVPSLDELRLHQGTVWHWNRAVYDPAEGGHLRVEMRSLPAGPTVTDMVANAAFLVGLTLAIAERAEQWIGDLPFAVPEHGFYRAAQQGLDAELLWPRAPGEAAEPVRARELVPRLIPLAHEGPRVASGQTAARWQRRTLALLEPRLGRPRALTAMLERYLDHAEADRPVHDWPVEVRRGAVRELAVPAPDSLPGTPVEFLRWLGGPALLRLAGRDRHRTRAVATLLHGNEPSGLRAVHAYLREGVTPQVDAIFFIGAVDAALAAPGFACRQLPGASDLNRCFAGPHEGMEGRVAREALELLREAQPEALVDLHNNTGRSIPYGVGPRAGDEELALVGYFGDRYVHSDLRLGALVEVTAQHFPSVVVECGRAGAASADAVARAGLDRYLGATRLAGGEHAAGIRVFGDPVRVEARPGVRLALGDRPDPRADLTIAPEIDRHNFDRLEPGHRIGWLREGADWPLVAVGGDGRDVARELFVAGDGALRSAREIIPIMITNDPGIALSDCLFYVVQRSESVPGAAS
jgi:hypothetical protein